MAREGILSIGATVDKTGVDAGLASIREGVQTAVQGVAVQVEQTTARTRAAWNKLGEDVKAASANVSAEALKVAEATKAQAAALTDLRRATVLARDANLSSATTTSILAAAQQKAASASAEVAAAKEAEAAAVAAANEDEKLSESAVVATFQEAGMEISDSLAGLRERLILTGQTAHISAREMTSAFSGLGELLGIGMLAGFGGEFLDTLAKMNVQLDHLRTETGISVTSLSGLQQIVKQMGADWDPVALGIVRINRAMLEAQAGMAQYKRAFTDVGITMDELKGKTPEEKLGIVARAFAHTANTSRVADAAITLFGRGGLQLIPVLKEEGANLEANMKRVGATTSITDESAEAARRWTQDTAELSSEFRSVMMPVMEHAGDVISGVAGSFEAGAFVIVGGFELIATAVVSVGKSIAGFGKVFEDLINRDFYDLPRDAAAAFGKSKDGFVDAWKDGFKEIGEGWQEVKRRFETPEPLAPPLPGIDPGDLTAPPGRLGRGGGEERGGGMRRERAGNARGYAETQAADLRAGNAAMIADLEAQARAQQAAARNGIEAAREAAQEKIRIAQQDYADYAEDLGSKVRLGKMTEEQRVTALKAASVKERAIEEDQSRFLELLDMGNLQRYQQDLNGAVQATRQWMRQMQQLNEQLALHTQQKYAQMFQRMTGPLNTFVDHWLTSGRRMDLAFAQMGNQIAMGFANNLVRMGEQWAAHELQMTMVHLAGVAQRKTADLAGQAASDAMDARQKTKDAAAAARGAYKAVSGIPVVGPFLAPLAAATAFAAVEAFEDGGVVRGRPGMGVPILAHAGERVLSRGQTTQFERMVNTNSTTATQENHFHYAPRLSGIDGASIEGMARKHGQAFHRETMRQLRLANRI